MVIPTTAPVPQVKLQDAEVQPINTDWHTQSSML
jgi:hypothetical protein